MSPYTPLEQFLLSSGQDRISTTFSELELILGFASPKSAYTYNAWWANGGHSQANAWLNAGYKVERADLQAQIVYYCKSVSVYKHKSQERKHKAIPMRDLASGLKEYDVVMAMPGVGNILGPRIIAEIGDARRFHSGSALVAYAALDAPPYQSGTFTGTNRHISKRGSSSLRKTGYEIIRFLKCVKPTKDTAVYDFLLKKESEGKPPRVAKIAALNKFLRIYYARVKELYR